VHYYALGPTNICFSRARQNLKEICAFLLKRMVREPIVAHIVEDMCSVLAAYEAEKARVAEGAPLGNSRVTTTDPKGRS
jgi:hypothetical protein